MTRRTDTAMTPKFTLISFRTPHGEIFALTPTAEPDRITYGFTGKEECIGQLRREHQKRYLYRGATEDVPHRPENTPAHKRLLAWFSGFLGETAGILPEAGRDIRLVRETRTFEVDHCTIEEWQELSWSPARGVFILDGYSSWYGSGPVLSTSPENPKEFDTVVGFIQKHREIILNRITTWNQENS